MGQWVQIFFYVGLMFYVFLLPAAVFRCHFMAEVCCVVCCSVLQCVAVDFPEGEGYCVVCCSVLQCAAVCCSGFSSSPLPFSPAAFWQR